MNLRDFFSHGQGRGYRVEDLQFLIPSSIDDDLLFLQMQISAHQDFSQSVDFNSALNEDDRAKVLIYDGTSSMIEHPSEGISSTYEGHPLTVSMNRYREISSRLFIKYRWIKIAEIEIESRENDSYSISIPSLEIEVEVNFASQTSVSIPTVNGDVVIGMVDDEPIVTVPPLIAVSDWKVSIWPSTTVNA